MRAYGQDSEIWVVEATPRAITTGPEGKRVFTPVTLYLSEREFITRPEDDPPSMPFDDSVEEILNLEIDAYRIEDGVLVTGGVARTEIAPIRLANGDGSFDAYDDAEAWSWDKAPVVVKKGKTEWNGYQWVPVAYSEFQVEAHLLAKGFRAEEKEAFIDLLDVLAELEAEVQAERMAGLGGALEVGVGEYVRIPHAAELGSPGTVMVLFRPNRISSGTNGFSSGAIMTKGESTSSPFALTQSPDGTLTVHFADGINGISFPFAGTEETWRWVVLTYDGAEARAYSGPIRGPLTLEGKEALTGPLAASSAELTLGRDPALPPADFEGTIGELRLLSVALAEEDLPAWLGPLDPEAPELIAWLDFGDRFGSYASDRVGEHDGLLTGYADPNAAWTTTGSGPPDAVGKPMPTSIGRARSVPLVPVDDPLSIWRVSFRRVREITFLMSAGIRLVPPLSLTSRDISFHAASQTIRTAGDLSFHRFVPDQEITVAGPLLNAGSFTVVRAFHRRIRVAEALVDEAAGGQVTVETAAGTEQWEDEGEGLVRLLTQTQGPLSADVLGDDGGPLGYRNTLAGVVELLLTDLGPKLPAASLKGLEELGGAGEARVNLYLGPEPATTREVLDRLLLSAGITCLPDLLGGLEFRKIPLPGELPPSFEISGPEDFEEGKVSRTRTGSPPHLQRVGYAQAHLTLTEDQFSESVLPEVRSFLREVFRWAEAEDPEILEGWPLSQPAEAFESLLTHLAEAQAEAARRLAVTQLRLHTLPLLDDPEPRVADPGTASYDRLTLEGEAVVVGLVRNPVLGEYKLVVVTK